MDQIPLILSIETATLGGSVFLGRGEQELATRKGNPEVSQSSSLLNDISETLAQAGVSLREVNLFACASGPGSFTGLRIGIATLKALAASLHRSCVGIPTLQAVALAGGQSRATIALLPAGRGEVFAQMFSVGNDGDVIELDAPAHLSPQKLVERYSSFKNLSWAGSGAQLQREFLERYAQTNEIVFAETAIESVNDQLTSDNDVWKLSPPADNLARHVARLALARFHAGRLESPESLSAIYVRPSDAELNQHVAK
jgi:tRNA threonylcarbamoyladenosine biosynthesis protein TsaB